MKKNVNQVFKINNFIISIEKDPEDENIKIFRVTKRLTNNESPVQICLSAVRGQHIQPYILRMYNTLIADLGYYISSIDIYLVPYGIKIKKWRERDWGDFEKKITNKINAHLSFQFIENLK